MKAAETREKYFRSFRRANARHATSSHRVPNGRVKKKTLRGVDAGGQLNSAATRNDATHNESKKMEVGSANAAAYHLSGTLQLTKVDRGSCMANFPSAAVIVRASIPGKQLPAMSLRKNSLVRRVNPKRLK